MSVSSGAMRGFDEIHHPQEAFRQLLCAMARPGTITSISTAVAAAPFGTAWSPTLAVIGLTLLDNEVTFAAIDGASGEPAAQLQAHLAQVTFAELRAAPEAEYVFVSGELSADVACRLLSQLDRGTLAYPEDGATLVLDAVELLAGCPSEAAAGCLPAPVWLELSGPGIRGTVTVAVRGVPSGLWEARNHACGEYPLGLDLVVVEPSGRMLAVPRTTHLELLPLATGAKEDR